MVTVIGLAPVAGGIADGKKDGLIFRFCFCKCFFTPGEPFLHGIMSMLQEVGGFLVYQPVGYF